MNESVGKNKKIPYPPQIPGYISTRLLKEQMLDFLRSNGKTEKANDSLVRSTIMRFKLYADKNDQSDLVLRRNDIGKAQFKIYEFIGWLKKKNSQLSLFKVISADE
jgi:hypothetical protein